MMGLIKVSQFREQGRGASRWLQKYCPGIFGLMC
jgi:hypothetical protein